MTYDFELWATLPEMETKQLEEEEVAEWMEVELDENEEQKVLDLLIACGGETSEEMVAEQLPQLHKNLRKAAEQMAKRELAMRLYLNKCYKVDADDFFEDDLKTGKFDYHQPEDVQGGVDDEEGYVDALYAWGEWEKARIEAMGDAECVEYLTTKYKIELDMSEVEWGYHLPDELAAEAIAKMMQ